MSILLAEPPIASDSVSAFQPDSDVVVDLYTDLDAAVSLWQRSVSFYDTSLTIDALEQGYAVLKDIPVSVSRVDDQTFLASFEEANIAITGFDVQDAYQSLIAEILDTFDTLVNEPRLSPAAATQLEILRTYIVEA